MQEGPRVGDNEREEINGLLESDSMLVFIQYTSQLSYSLGSVPAFFHSEIWYALRVCAGIVY